MTPLTQPQREFLADQVAAILRREIAAGRWSAWLPGERNLAQVLNVSRPTVRTALRQLRAAREIEVHARNGYAIRSGRRGKVARSAQPIREVVIICPEHIYSMPSHVIQLVNVIRALCAEAGLSVEIVEGRRFSRNDPGRIMPRVVRAHPGACCIAIMAGRRSQEWLVHSGTPSVIYGNTYPDIDLPSVGIDYRACIRHAAALLLARGHRRVVLVNFDPQRAGDQESMAGFHEAFAAHAAADANPIVLSRPDDDLAALRRQIDQVIRVSPRPTAFIVARTHHYATLATHLAQRGWRMPQDASLISRGDDPFLHFLCPAPAHYRVNIGLLARRLFRCVQRIVSGARQIREHYRVLPEFVAGESVGPPPVRP